MPQIEVQFDIDANGILHVSAKDKATGKENKITIKASSGLTEDEIQRMVKDAEAHAEDDRKQLEVVQARNALDSLVHSVKKSVGEYGDKVDADEKGKIEAAVKDAEALLKQPDAGKEALEAKAEELAKASQKLGEIMYAQAQAEAQKAAGGADGGADGGKGAGGKAEEKVVDAEYTEVKDTKS
jgi:molecular chaperone DnaK